MEGGHVHIRRMLLVEEAANAKVLRQSCCDGPEKGQESQCGWSYRSEGGVWGEMRW